jgi:hypothetical protein
MTYVIEDDYSTVAGFCKLVVQHRIAPHHTDLNISKEHLDLP